MALPESSLSIMCSSVADFLRERLDSLNNNIRVMIGAPSEAAQLDSQHHLNLFFYHVEPAGFGLDPAADETWRIRMHCLITPFGILEEQISAGENELRLLGEVVRVFHEYPVLDLPDVQGEHVRLQVVMQPLSGDELNHIWSTQGDTSYRPSVAYEFAQGVVVPAQQGIEAPWAGRLGTQVFARMDARYASFTGSAAPPPVQAARVDTQVEDWAPRICLVHQSACAQSLALSVGSEASAFTPTVWVAGDTASTVTLQWEIWDSTVGWRAHPATVDVSPISSAIDPESIPSSGLATLALPFNDHAGQAVLHASRTFTRGATQAQETVRSNPLLVTLY